MRRVRFSLRGLILLVTAAGLFLGYSQHRRREILKTCGVLSDYGYVLSVPNQWHDRLWQRMPAVGATFYDQNRELLLTDLQNEAEDEKPIANLQAVGVMPASVRELERRRKEAQRERIEKLLKWRAAMRGDEG